MRPTGIIEAVRMVLVGNSQDLVVPGRRYLDFVKRPKTAIVRLFTRQPNRRGFWFRGRPSLDPMLVRGIIEGASQVNPKRIAILQENSC